MSRISFFLWVVMFALASCRINLPPDLRRIMANVNSLESFMKAFDLGNITLGSAPPQPPRFRPAGQGELLGIADSNRFERKRKRKPTGAKLRKIAVGRTRVVSFHDDSVTSPPILLEEASCKPYPTVVKVPQPAHHQGIHYPLNVLLHRCAGSCNSKPRVQECVPTATENISLLAFLVSWNSPSDSKGQWHKAHRIIPIANHTQCGCRCIAKPSDCDPATQVFSDDNCRCECRAKSRPCPAYHRWDRVRCKCVCHPPSYITCPRRFQWSPEKCKCVCKQTPCRANKVRNQRNCRCYCRKLPICSIGFRKNRRTCKCIKTNG